MSDALQRALEDIAERRSHQADEVVVRRFDGEQKCGMRRYGSCYRKAMFEIRGAVRIRACVSCVEDALTYSLTPLESIDAMEEHFGRHSSIVLREECRAYQWRVEGFRKEPVGERCFDCDRTSGKPKRCVICGKRTKRRCTCLAAVHYDCHVSHSVAHGAEVIVTEGGFRFIRRGAPGHNLSNGGIP